MQKKGDRHARQGTELQPERQRQAGNQGVSVGHSGFHDLRPYRAYGTLVLLPNRSGRGGPQNPLGPKTF